jgi:Ankyrin repeat
MRYSLASFFLMCTFISTTFLSSMDGPPKKTSFKRKSRASSKSQPQLTTPQMTPSSTIDIRTEHALLKFTHQNDINRVKFYLNNPDLDHNLIVDTSGNTALHIAAKNRFFEIIDEILLNHKVNACQANNDFKTAPQLLSPSEVHNGDPELIDRMILYRKKLFARCTLTARTLEHTGKIYPHYKNGSIDEAVFNGTIKRIQTKIDADKIKQDAELPAETQLPAYATDEFILRMINYHLGLLSHNSLYNK